MMRHQALLYLGFELEIGKAYRLELRKDLVLECIFCGWLTGDDLTATWRTPNSDELFVQHYSFVRGSTTRT